MTQYLKEIVLDFSGGASTQRIVAKQGDKKSRFIKISPILNNQQLAVDADCTIDFRCIKPDKTSVITKATQSSDGKITVELPEQALAVTGDVQADIAIIGNEGEILSSSEFIIEVRGTLTDTEEYIPSEDYFKRESDIDMNNHQIKNLSAPQDAHDATTKEYVDGKIPNGITQENGVLQLTANGEKVGEGAHLPFWKEVIKKPDTTLVFDPAKADPDTALQKCGRKLGLVIGKTYQIEVIIDGNESVLVESTAVDGTEQVGFECALMEINNPVPDSSGNIEAYAYIYDGFDMDFVNGTFVKADEAVFTVAHPDTTLVIHDLPETVTTVHKIPAEYLPTDEILNAESIIENIVIDMPFFENQPAYSGASFTFSPDDFFYIIAADAAAGTFKLSYDSNGSSLVSDSTFSMPALDTGNCGVLEDRYKVQLSGDNSNLKMRLLGEYGTAYGTLNKAIPKKSGYDICEFEIEALACADIYSGKFNSEGSENIGAIVAMPTIINDVMKLTFYSADTWDSQQSSSIEIALRGVSDRPARTYLIHSKGTIDFSNDRVIVSSKTASAGMVQDTSGSVTNTYPHIYDKQVWIYPTQSDYNMKELVNTVVIIGAFLNGTKIKLTWRKKHE